METALENKPCLLVDGQHLWQALKQEKKNLKYWVISGFKEILNIIFL